MSSFISKSGLMNHPETLTAVGGGGAKKQKILSLSWDFWG